MRTLGIISIGLILAYLSGYWTGGKLERKEWEKREIVREERAREVERITQNKEETLTTLVQSLQEELNQRDKAHEQALSDIHTDYTNRLSQQEARTSHYRSLSTGSRDSQLCLANHAGELAESLIEGRRLVKEFKQYASEWKNRLYLCEQEHQTTREILNGH